jgi:hypothetical protein
MGRTGRQQHATRLVLALTATLIGLLLSATAASATPPTHEPFSLVAPGVVERGTFQDNFVDFYTGTLTTFYDERRAGEDGHPGRTRFERR